jgi:hypothetical protein
MNLPDMALVTKLQEQLEDEGARLTQLIKVIRKLKECSHACCGDCPHTRKFDAAVEMLDPAIQRRIRE